MTTTTPATIDDYLERLASAAPTPGGGSAAALVAAHGAALVAMVGRITADAPRHAASRPQALVFVAQADELRARLRRAGEADERAYEALRAVFAMPKASAEEAAAREAAREPALREAAEAPLVVAEAAAAVALLAQAALSLRNPHLVSDLICAAEFAIAGTNAAAANVLVNHRLMRDPEALRAQQTRLLAACTQADAACGAVRSELVAQGG